MDFDIFMYQDDPDLWYCYDNSSAISSNDNMCEDLTPEMHCLGADSWETKFSEKGFIRNFAIFENQQPITRNDCFMSWKSAHRYHVEDCYDPNVLNFLLDDACHQILDLMENINDNFNTENNPDNDNYLCRHQVTNLLRSISRLNGEWSYLRPHIARLRLLFNNCTTEDILQRIYNVPNTCGSPSFHLMHGALEWKILDLFLLHKNEPMLSFDDITNVFYTQLNRILDDLITCSVFVYKSVNTYELLSTTPFACICFREIWLLLQLFIPKWFASFNMEEENAITFWKLYNKAMERLKLKLDKLLLNGMQYYEFNNWLMNAVIRLYGYEFGGHFDGSNGSRLKDKHAINYEAYENCVQNFLQLNPSEEHLRVFIALLQPILVDWCEPKIAIPTLLWEYFYKRLNTNFYTSIESASKQVLNWSSADSFLKQYKLLMSDIDRENIVTVKDINSFTQFTLLISKILQRLCMVEQQHNVQKLLGRIYIKFSPQKFLSLNEVGIYQISELFIGLAICDNSQDLLAKIREKLLLISLEKVNTKRQLAILKAHMVMLILHAERGLDINEYISKLLQQLNAISLNIDLYRIVVNSLWPIFSQTRDFKSGVHLLINKWLPNFLNKCIGTDQQQCLESLYLILCQVNEEKNNNLLFSVLFEHILPYVKAQYVCSSSKWLPVLAAEFCIQYNILQDDTMVKQLILYFVETQTFNAQASCQFVLHIYKRGKRNLLSEMQIMQVWLKMFVLMDAQNLELIQMNSYVTQLQLWKTLSNLQIEEVINSNEPLTTFINGVAMIYDHYKENYEQCCLIADNFNNLLKNFENWIPSQTLINAHVEANVRFYNFIAVVISNCSHFVYIKSKITCFFHVALTRFILTTDIQIGKTPNKRFAQIIHKIWSFIVQGIARLNYRTDSYVEKTLNDLIQKWVPHFKVSTNKRVVASPFVTCLKHRNEDFTLFLCEKLANCFLLTERRQAHINSCLAIVILQEGLWDILNADNQNILQRQTQLCNLIKGIGFYLLEHIMMLDDIVPSRSIALDFICRLTSCNLYAITSDIRIILIDQLKLLTHNYLAYHTYFYFELLNHLATLDKKIILDIWDTLMAEILVVEKKRCVGEDQKIREYVNKLQMKLK